jgi:hypothetical protein
MSTRIRIGAPINATARRATGHGKRVGMYLPAAAVALAAAMFLVVATAQTPGNGNWRNWDQAKAFEDSQKRVASGKDPLPGVRSCFWRYGPSSGDPYLNIAYPDAATVYWGAVFSMPKGAKLHIEGQFAHARYQSFISYDFKGAPIESVADYLMKPVAGSVNPYLEGVERSAKNRSYQIEVLNQPLPTAMRWGVYLKGETREAIHAPQQADNTQQQILYRIYAADKGHDETAGVGLPEAVVTMPDGRVLRGRDACTALRTGQPLQVDQAALSLPRTELQKLIDDAKKRVGPAGPATEPPTWLKSTEDTSRFALYTGDMTSEAGARKQAGSFYANQDNQYLRAFVNRKFGEVFVMRAKAPTTPKTWDGTGAWSNAGELRYWSWCSNQGFGTARVNACLFDEQIPTDANGFYTIVMSRAADRPRNAIRECGVAWLPMADVGDGTGETDLTIIMMRQMLGAGEFKHALYNNKSQATLQQDLGPYFPRGRYTSVAAFETFMPCLIEKR